MRVSHAVIKKRPKPLFYYSIKNYAENEEPHPQVEVAFGFLITN